MYVFENLGTLKLNSWQRFTVDFESRDIPSVIQLNQDGAQSIAKIPSAILSTQGGFAADVNAIADEKADDSSEQGAENRFFHFLVLELTGRIGGLIGYYMWPNS